LLSGQPATVLDYPALRDPQLGPAPPRGAARLLVAGTVGGTRLIDNVCVQIGGS
jgi:pantoate--beta-alanine ligase